jgi:predicted histone-like DNA-binding protein
MPIILNKIERGKPADKTVPKKWYATPRTVKQVKENDVAKQIASRTTLDRKEAEMAVELLGDILIDNLLSGNSVQLGEWGSFYITCSSEGTDKREELTTNAVKNLNVRFNAGKALKDALKNATFVFAEDLVTK